MPTMHDIPLDAFSRERCSPDLTLAVLVGVRSTPRRRPRPPRTAHAHAAYRAAANLTIRIANDVPDMRPWSRVRAAEEQLTSLL